ncbi:uncharacterized protein LOC116336644 [Contarinia nasturtii]|uniref:uncharacterized protein LOC116336644 n=1 Tax=Contarinia nasturtii TaxID=265458 RepID=UPI0012D492FF|nr:uncharacterized protein LOC116336644 [Contarinia nasturtii]
MTSTYTFCLLAFFTTFMHGNSVMMASMEPLALLKCLFNATESAIVNEEEFYSIWQATQARRDEIMQPVDYCNELKYVAKIRACRSAVLKNGRKLINEMFTHYEGEKRDLFEFLVETSIDEQCSFYSGGDVDFFGHL